MLLISIVENWHWLWMMAEEKIHWALRLVGQIEQIA